MLMLGLYTLPPSSGGTLILDATPFVTAATITTDVHGCEALNFTALRPIAEAFTLYNQTAIVYVGIFDGAALIWEGRLEDPALNAGAGGSGFRGQVLGSWRAFSDIPYTALWSETRVGEWSAYTPTQIAAARDKQYIFDTNNRVFMGLIKGTTYATGADVGFIGFAIPDQSSRNLIGIQFALSLNLPTNWVYQLVTRDASYGGATVIDTFVSAGAAISRAYHFTFTGQPRIDFVIYNGTGAPVTIVAENGIYGMVATSLRLVSATTNRVNTTLTVARTNGAGVTCTVGSTARMYVGMQLIIGSGGANSEVVTVASIGGATTFTATIVNAGAGYAIGTTVQGFVVYADEIAGDLLATVAALNSAQLSTSTTQIQSPALDLTDEVYEDRLPADILSYLASRGDSQQRAWEVGVGRGQVLYLRPQFSAVRAWYVDVTDLDLARTLNNLFNSAYGLYEDANGRSLRTVNVSDSASVSRYALTRRAAAPATTTNAVLAATQRDTFITNNHEPAPRATVRFNAVFDAQGARWPLFLVKAGDTITVRNVSPSVSSSYDKIRTFRVTHTTYDLKANTLSVEPEIAPPTIASMIVFQAPTTVATGARRPRDVRIA